SSGPRGKPPPEKPRAFSLGILAATDRNHGHLALGTSALDGDLLDRRRDLTAFLVADLQAVAIDAVGHGQTALVLAVPLDVSRGLARAAEAADDLVALVHDLERPAIGVGLGPRVERDLGHRMLTGRREDRRLGLRAGEEAAESIADADAMRQPQRLVGRGVL